MKKRTQLILAAVCAMALVAAFALVGCGGSGSSSSSAASSSSSAASSSSSSSSSAASSSSSSAAAEAVELQVFAANSLSKAMDEAQALYTTQNPEVTFADTQYLSSGDLNAELEGGAYADIEITASKATMDTAEEKGFIDPDTRITMFTNDLVIVAGEGSELATQYGTNQDFTLKDVATGDYTVAIGDDSVPAGNYANQALSTVGCYVTPDGTEGKDATGKEGSYEGTPLEGKVNLQSSVGNVCKAAQSGDSQIAFVYTSDVERFEGVTVIGVVPADTHKNITYPGAVTAQSEYADESAAFIDWCMTDKDALEIWQKWGFELAA